MSMYELSSQYNPLLQIPLIIISILISFFFYHNTSLTSLKKYFFILLKSFAIYLFLLLFLHPILIALVSENKSQINLVLIDDTRSNQLPQNNGTPKKDELIQKLKTNFVDESFLYIPFSNGNISEIQTDKFDSLSCNGYITNISQTLRNIRNTYPDYSYNSIFILSDGLFNEGGSPVRDLLYFNTPVFVLPIGDTLQKKDAVIMNVIHNDKAFIETSVKIRIDLKVYDLKNENLVLRLYNEGKEINSKTIVPKEDEELIETGFEFKSEKTGLQKFKISIDKITSEITYANNYQGFYIEFIDNKVKTLYISSAPSPDNAIFIRTIKNIKNYDAEIRTQKSSSSFFEGNIERGMLANISIVILNGFPSEISSQDFWNNILSQIKEYKIPVIFFSQKYTDYKKLAQLDNQIPFTPVQISEEHLTKISVINTEDNPFNELSENFNSAPQIFSNIGTAEQKTGSTAWMLDNNGNPFLITKTENGVTSSSVLGYGFWRWFLSSQKSYSTVFEKLLIKLTEITVSKEKKKRFKVYPEKRFFDYTEPVTLIAEVYNNEYKPVNTAKITGKILSDGKIIQDKIIFKSDANRYSIILSPLNVNDYEIIAEAENINEFLGEEKDRFTVDTLNTEYLYTATNMKTLREITSSANGIITNTDKDNKNIKNIVSELNTNDKTYRAKITFRLWENKYYLLLIIFLFSLEWALRKRNNLT